MKIDGKITLLFDPDRGLNIEIEDANARTTFVKLNVKNSDVTKLMSRQAMIPCSLEIRDLKCVGKIHKCKKFDFEIPEKLSIRENREKLIKYSEKFIPKGWIPDGYYNSQDSFYTENGKHFARVVIRKWSKKKSIDRFDGDYDFLSNFYKVKVKYEGITYPSSENAYQASKTLDKSVRETFVNLTASKSKELGQKLKKRGDWDNVKERVMHEVLLEKFKNKKLKGNLK
jgi:hypothetical protein